MSTKTRKCVALYDQIGKPQCPNDAVDTTHLLCREHLDEWHRVTNDRWRVTLHD